MTDLLKTSGEEEYRKGLEQLNSNEQYNLRNALCYFCEAAEKQHAEAMLQAGLLYLFAEPQIIRNVSKATEYFKKSADSGIATAKDYMAVCYLLGIEVEKNEELAVRILEDNFKIGDYLAAKPRRSTSHFSCSKTIVFSAFLAFVIPALLSLSTCKEICILPRSQDAFPSKLLSRLS